MSMYVHHCGMVVSQYFLSNNNITTASDCFLSAYASRSCCSTRRLISLASLRISSATWSKMQNCLRVLDGLLSLLQGFPLHQLLAGNMPLWQPCRWKVAAISHALGPANICYKPVLQIRFTSFHGLSLTCRSCTALRPWIGIPSVHITVITVITVPKQKEQNKALFHSVILSVLIYFQWNCSWNTRVRLQAANPAQFLWKAASKTWPCSYAHGQ